MKTLSLALLVLAVTASAEPQPPLLPPQTPSVNNEGATPPPTGRVEAKLGLPKKGAAADSKDFARLKTLEGVWSGLEEGRASGKELEVRYSLAAGGAILVETDFPGTDHESVSVYYDKDGQPALTHYSVTGSRPGLKQVKRGEGELYFEFQPGSGPNPAKDDYLYSVSIRFKDADNIRQEWKGWHNGKPGHIAALSLSRKK